MLLLLLSRRRGRFRQDVGKMGIENERALAAAEIEDLVEDLLRS